jgi:hypothetical protein
MKKPILFSLSVLGLGLIAQASTITCTTSPTQIAGGVGTATLNCPSIDAGAGFTIGNLQLLLASDYINGPISTTSGTTVSILYSASANFANHTEAVSGGFSSSGSTTDGNPNVGGGPFLAETINVGTQTLAGFTLTETSSVMSGGPVNASTINAFLVYTPTAIQSGTPEPATLGLMGSALLGLGFLARRKKN